MTREEFTHHETDPCRHCAGRVELKVDPHIPNRIQVYCSNSFCRQRGTPWGLVIFVKASDRKSRAGYPFGKDVASVWEDYGNTCIICGITRDECVQLGVPLERQHTMEYAKFGHEGPILPICGHCHPIATQLQKLRAFIRRSLATLHQEPVAK